LNAKSRLASVAAVLAVLAITATALAATTPGSQVKTRKISSLSATILVDGKGKSLYMFAKDKNDKSACSGSCATFWPPYMTTGKPKAGPGAKQALLGTTKRSNGKLQVTYNRHPLYYFKLDTKAGQAKGENQNAFGGHWYAVSPKGAKIPPAPASTGGGGYGGGGGPTGPTGSGGYGGGPGYGGG
jgi:predicted lipoprotein with Yx(FWY)xxD motif